MRLNKDIKAQSTIEFTLAMVAIMFLVYGMVQIFRWAGLDLANRRYLQDSSFVVSNKPDPTQMLSSNAGDSFLPVGAVYHGSVTK